MKIFGFIHIGTFSNEYWIKILDEQKYLIRKYGLYTITEDISLSAVGVRSEWVNDDEKFKVVHRNEDITKFEFPTLQILHKKCLEEDCLVWYIHTKGSSKPGYQRGMRWRRYMQYYCIALHDLCIESLKEYDTCGANWNETRKIYEGNFWWARSSYIKTLDKPEIDKNRMLAEDWLGTGNVTPACLNYSRAFNYPNSYDYTNYQVSIPSYNIPLPTSGKIYLIIRNNPDENNLTLLNTIKDIGNICKDLKVYFRNRHVHFSEISSDAKFSDFSKNGRIIYMQSSMVTENLDNLLKFRELRVYHCKEYLRIIDLKRSL